MQTGVRTRAGRFAATALLAILAAPEAGAGPAGWRHYHNDRFGYSLDYPAGRLRALAEADNSDGRRFVSARESVSVAVWGSYNAANQTIADLAADAERGCEGGRAAYRVVRKLARGGMMAVSCPTPMGEVYYSKAFIVGDVVTQVVIDYPLAAKAVWDPLAARISASLTAGGGTD